MKTDNVYIAMLNVVVKVQRADKSGYCLYGIPIYNYDTFSKPLRPVLVLCKQDKYGKRIIKDLNTKEEYFFEAHSNLGDIFVNSASLYPFNNLMDNSKSNLSKRKILKMGNQAINEIMQKNKEEENK